MADSRIPVGLTDHQRQRIQAYADRHGASLAGAILALAIRQLDAEDGGIQAATEARHNRSRNNVATR